METARQEQKKKITEFLISEGFDPNQFGQVIIEDGKRMFNLNCIILNYLDEQTPVTLE